MLNHNLNYAVSRTPLLTTVKRTSISPVVTLLRPVMTGWRTLLSYILMAIAIPGTALLTYRLLLCQSLKETRQRTLVCLATATAYLRLGCSSVSEAKVSPTSAVLKENLSRTVSNIKALFRFVFFSMHQRHSTDCSIVSCSSCWAVARCHIAPVARVLINL